MGSARQMSVMSPAAEGPVSTASPASVVSARDLGLVFKTNDGPVTALTGVTLDIRKGDFVSFIGPSGCGKTTFLRVIADLEKATSGTITVNGTSPEDARRNRSYGYVFPGGRALSLATIEKNIALPLEIMGYPEAEKRARIARTLDLVNLTVSARNIPGSSRRHAAARLDRPRARLRCRPPADGRALCALDEIVRDHLNEQLLSLWDRRKRPSASSPIPFPRPSISPPRSW